MLVARLLAMPLTVSCAFATSLSSHEHARIAESLGYERALFYDSPALYPDVWVQLCRAAERTDRIGLGPGVLVPSNRHPMTNAAAIATLAQLAGAERVTVAVGSGFTGRMAMGQRALPWAQVSSYVRALQGLLRGDVVEWDGAQVQMLHGDGFAPPRPLTVRWLIAAAGPKGEAAAHELGDGIIGAPGVFAGFDWSAVLIFGTVLDDGEKPGSARALAAAGHAGSVQLHAAEEYGVLDRALGPRAGDYRAAYADIPEGRRHLAMHEGHCVAVNDRDRPFVDGDLLAASGLALPAAGWRERLAGLEAAGATEVVFQPAGPDIPRELEAFAQAARG
jgi:5,10-methylenetetrahydromethanopterin reductase